MDLKEIKEFHPSHPNPLCRNAQIDNFERHGHFSSPAFEQIGERSFGLP